MDDTNKEPDWDAYRKAKEKEEVGVKKKEIGVWFLTMFLVVVIWGYIEKSSYTGTTWPIYSAILFVFLFLYSLFYRMVEKQSKKKLKDLHHEFIGE